MNRSIGIFSLAFAALLSGCGFDDPARETRVYKVIDGCQLKVDVFRPAALGQRPAILWLHGGGLIAGCRDMLGARGTKAQLQRYMRAGIVVVAVDYRLAPETKLAGILDDIRDAYRWTRTRGAAEFSIDSNRVALVGHSAGGYLALLGGVYLEPRPSAIVSFYGYGEILGDWCTHPSAYFVEKNPIAEGEARASAGDGIISHACYPTKRNRFYEFCRQRGLWTKEVTGFDPLTDSTLLMRFCPLLNITPEYPPTLLLHGDKDHDVPYEQSLLMEKKLELAGVRHGLITLAGLDHGFDYTNWNDAQVRAAFDSASVFLMNSVNTR